MRAPQKLEAKKIEEVASLMIPFAGRQWLVPNVTVAEIVPVPEIHPNEQVPAWYLGDCLWRELRIPVFSFESLHDEPLPEYTSRSRLAVLNTTGANDQLPFMAVLTTGLPRLARVSEEELAIRDDEKKAFDLIPVAWAGEDAVIPDIESIEYLLLPYWLTVLAKARAQD